MVSILAFVPIGITVFLSQCPKLFDFINADSGVSGVKPIQAFASIYDFHKVGRKYDDVISLLHRWENYSEVIIFTGNGEGKHHEIKKYLENNNIKYKGINCDSSVYVSGRKTYANVYIDDRGGLPLVYRMLEKLITKIENGEVVYE